MVSLWERHTCGLRDIKLTREQKIAIQKRRRQHKLTLEEKRVVIQRLRPHQFKKIYTDEQLVDKIRGFYKQNNRIPLKGEFNSLRIYRKRFGSWNNAIMRAGLDPNSHLYAQRCTAADGHICDSLGEKIVDDWLSKQKIGHTKNVPYPGKNRLTADFGLADNVLIEFFGLAGAGNKRYEQSFQRKKKIIERQRLRVVELYPNDLKNLSKKLPLF